MQKQVSEFLAMRFSVLRHVRDAMADSQDKQKERADAKGRGCIDEVGDQVLLNAKDLPTNVVSSVSKKKLRQRFIGPFTVIAKKVIAYTLNIPRKLHTQPVSYVVLLKPYHYPYLVNRKALAPKGGTPSLLAESLSRVPTGCSTPPSAGAC